MTSRIPHFGVQVKWPGTPKTGATEVYEKWMVPRMGIEPKQTNNLKRLRMAAKLTQQQAADKFGMSKSGYIKLEDGERGLKTDRIRKAAEIFQVRLEDVISSTGIPMSDIDDEIDSTQVRTFGAGEVPRPLVVYGLVAAGRWQEIDNDVDEPAFDPAPIYSSPRWPAADQFVLIVRGNSVNKIAEEGDFLHCVSTESCSPTNGRLVIVEQIKHEGQSRARTVKSYHEREGGGYDLKAVSSDAEWQMPIHIPQKHFSFFVDDDVEIKIVAVVVGAYKNIF